MSEPDAVPLPRDGEVFFDVRGDARSMRLSWYADSSVAVFSIWQGNRCTGTFRLPFADLARMVQALQSGPPLTGSGQADFGSTSYGGYDSAGYASADYDGTGYQYSGSGYGDLDRQPATASYQAAGYSDPGYDSTGSYGENADSGYGAVSDAGPSRSGFGAEPGYPDPGYAAGHPYDAQQAPAASYLASPSQEYPAPYTGSQEYPGPDYGSAGHAGAAPNYGLADYDPPNYGEPSVYHGGSHRRADSADDVAAHSNRPQASPPDYRPATESESVPDGAMLSFPSVPARNGPYR